MYGLARRGLPRLHSYAGRADALVPQIAYGITRRRTGVTKLTERLNSPVQGSGADGIKLAVALLYERRDECPGAVPILAVHDEILVEVDVGDQAEDVGGWLKKAMVDGMDEVLNPGLGADHSERVPVEVD